MKALIATIREFPMFNASIDDEKQEIIYKKYFNLGFAADTPNGLVVPVIKNADQKSLLELSKEILELSKKARDGKLKPDEMKKGHDHHYQYRVSWGHLCNSHYQSSRSRYSWNVQNPRSSLFRFNWSRKKSKNHELHDYR